MQTEEMPGGLTVLAPALKSAMLETRQLLETARTAEDIARIRVTLQKITQALNFVDEPSLAVFFNAMAQVLAAEQDGSARPERAQVAESACVSLLHYLDDLTADSVPHPLPHPLRLFHAYKALLATTGQERIHPVDLVFPKPISDNDLRFPCSDEAAPGLSETILAACRTEFESLLLNYLHATDANVGASFLRRMADVIGKVVNMVAVSHHKNFWRTIEAAVMLFADGGIDVDQYAKKFLGQVNLQLRRLVSGMREGDARLLREGLFFIALAPAAHEAAHAIKQANALPEIQQADYQQPCYAAIDAVQAASATYAAPAVRDPGQIALAELEGALGRTEALIESSFNKAYSRAEAARVAKAIRELAGVAERLKLDVPAQMLGADALRIENASGADDAATLQPAALKSAIYNLAALSLSLPLMRRDGVMPYRGKQSEVAHTESDASSLAAKTAQPEQLEEVESPAPGLAAGAASEEPVDEDVDPEFLDIFLTEAEEILDNVDNALAASRGAPDDMVHVGVLRRGFHTLKGSSRMVGLNALSDGAMAIETFLNEWLTQATPGSSAAYALLEHAKREMTGWIGELRERGKSARRADALIAAVEQTRQAKSMDGAETGVETTSAAASAPAVADEEQSVRIGEMEIPAQLHLVYCKESASLLATISSHLEQWQEILPTAVAPEVLRATHSLKSSSASVQFAALNTLAQALDDVIQCIAHFPGALDANVSASLLQIVRQLQTMQQMFASRRMPPARADLQQQLHALLDGMKQLRREASSDAPGQGHPLAAVSPEEDPADAGADLIDPELLEIFLEEGRDLLPQIGESLHKLQKSPDNRGLIQYLLRPLHTIKGSARMAGAMRLGQHMHELESSIDEMVRTGTPSVMQIDDLLARYDHGLQLFEALQVPLAVPPMSPVLARDEQGADKPAVQIVLPGSDAAGSSEADIGKTVNAAPLVRIRAGILDSLLNQAGEISISRSGLESEVDVLRQHLADLGGNVARLTTQLREVEIQAEIQIAASNQRQPQNQHFDPLEFDRFTHLQEMTRMLAESVNDVASLQKNLLETVDHAQNSLTQQARLTREMQQELMRARMVQFRGVEERLHRLVRQMAKETGKELELEIRGSAVEVDRSILEKMVGPFEHLLRNAAAHGIETAEQRRKAGKPAVGRLSLEISQEGYEVMICLSDDGRGLDLAGIHEKAVRLGLIDAGQVLSDTELTGMIFQPGFTTSADVTAIAGRGVGMDVVRSEVASLGGRISIDTVAGEGATFIIHLPLSLAVTQVVLLELGEQTYAIPSLLVEQVLQLKAAEQAEVFREGTLDWQGRKLPMHYLPVLLGEDKGVPAGQTLSILVVKSGHDFLAILVDRIIGNREVVTKNIGPQLAHMVGVVGATVLGSGSIALILNPIQLAQRHGYQKVLRQVEPAAGGDNSNKKTILVVDDSLTVRRVMQRLLTREGYHVVLATDGVDALHQLQDVRPDVALVDIEMPRMDGFDLARNIRDMSGTARLPIIMITSRTAAKHRERAMELGVNEYLGKPYQEKVLLETIRRLTGEDADNIDEVLFAQAEPPASDGTPLPEMDDQASRPD